MTGCLVFGWRKFTKKTFSHIKFGIIPSYPKINIVNANLRNPKAISHTIPEGLALKNLSVLRHACNKRRLKFNTVGVLYRNDQIFIRSRSVTSAIWGCYNKHISYTPCVSHINYLARNLVLHVCIWKEKNIVIKINRNRKSWSYT